MALGTALYGTFEALDTDAAKQRLVAAVSTDTIVSTVYDVVRGPEWPDGYVGRSLRTHLTDRWAGREGRLRREREPIQRLYAEAVEANDVDTRVVWAGMGIDQIERIHTAADVIHRFPIAPRSTT